LASGTPIVRLTQCSRRCAPRTEREYAGAQRRRTGRSSGPSLPRLARKRARPRQLGRSTPVPLAILKNRMETCAENALTDIVSWDDLSPHVSCFYRNPIGAARTDQVVIVSAEHANTRLEVTNGCTCTRMVAPPTIGFGALVAHATEWLGIHVFLSALSVQMHGAVDTLSQASSWSRTTPGRASLFVSTVGREGSLPRRSSERNRTQQTPLTSRTDLKAAIP
jgi:hypothetical protein